MARIVAVTNQKGGVGKTTTAINLAASLALADQRVLLVDLDPQGNMTSGVGLRGQQAPGGTVYSALESDAALDPTSFVIPSAVDNLKVVPADGASPAPKSSSSASPTASAGCGVCSSPCARTSTGSSSTARPRSACSRSTRSSPPTRC